MLRWLEANGYARNSAEGQMRYMTHEAMTDRTYGRTRRILMGEGSGNIDADTNTITENFESPKVINRRSGAVRQALRTGPEQAPEAPPSNPSGNRLPNGAPAILKPNSMKDAPGETMGEANQRREVARKPVTVKDILPNGIPGAFNGNLPSFASPAAPNVSNADNSKTIHVSIKQGDTHVRGVDDPKRAADHIGAVAGYRNSDLVRNLRSSLA